jgi:hypothetical protein
MWGTSQKLLLAEESTFPDASAIGLWSKADAQSYFDDLVIAQRASSARERETP